MRHLLVVIWLLIGLLVTPALTKLPGYLGSGGASLDAWVSDWLKQPVRGAVSLMRPESDLDRSARLGWLVVQGILLVPLLSVLWPEYRGSGGKLRADPSGAHGSARWRKVNELGKTLQRIGVRSRAPAGILAGVDRDRRPRQAWVIPGPHARSATNPHVLVLGGSGSGKTRRLVLPNLWLLGRAKAAGDLNSIVLTDPKGELYSYTADYFRKMGYKVRTLNLIDPKRSDRYNPLAEVAGLLAAGDRSAAAEAVWDIAHAFASMDDDKGAHREDPFWQNAAESIIAATVYYVAAHAPEGQKNMASVYRLITEYGKDDGSLLDLVFQSIPDLTDPARTAYGVTQLSVEKTRSSILTTAAVNLRLFADPTVTNMTAASDESFASIGQEPTVVYLLLPDDKSSRNAIAAIYLQQMYSALTKLAAHSPGGRIPVPVFWLLDEFANIGKFKDFDKMISVMRGRGMAAMIILQALQQLEARYGKETADVITANCDTWLFLRTNDRKTAQELSEKIGQYTVRTAVGNASFRQYETSGGISEQLSGRALLTPDEVLRWQQGQVLVMQAGQHPAQLKLADITEWPARFKAGDPPPVRQDDREAVAWLPFSG